MDKPFSSMLAVNAPKSELIKFPVLGSPKLDGVRGHAMDDAIISRKFLPFRNRALQATFGKQIHHGLDGEFIQGNPTDENVFGNTQSITSSFDINIERLTFWVFDDFTNPQWPFYRRLEQAHDRIRGRDHMRPVEHTVLNTPEQLDAYEEEQVNLGYEGIMIRHPEGPYKYGRSTAREGWLLKVKRFEDSECVIDGAEELMHNQNEKTLISNGKAKRNHRKEGMVPGGTLGKLCVRDIHTKVAFKIGTGFTAAMRAELWAMHKAGKLVGRVGTYKWLPAGTKDKPRSGVWKGFRMDL